jgi:hypothetical protein
MRRRLCLHVGCSVPGHGTSGYSQRGKHILLRPPDSTALSDCATSGDIEVPAVSAGGCIASFSASTSPAGLSFRPLPLHTSPWSLIEHLEHAPNESTREYVWSLIAVCGYSAWISSWELGVYTSLPQSSLPGKSLWLAWPMTTRRWSFPSSCLQPA